MIIFTSLTNTKCHVKLLSLCRLSLIPYVASVAVHCGGSNWPVITVFTSCQIICFLGRSVVTVVNVNPTKFSLILFSVKNKKCYIVLSRETPRKSNVTVTFKNTSVCVTIIFSLP